LSDIILEASWRYCDKFYRLKFRSSEV